jgi:hypothetical protein
MRQNGPVRQWAAEYLKIPHSDYTAFYGCEIFTGTRPNSNAQL